MAGPFRHLPSQTPRGVDANTMPRSQDALAHLPGRVSEDIDPAAVDRNSQFMAMSFQSAPEQTAAGMSGLIKRGLAEETPEKFETFVRALQIIDSQNPGMARRILEDAGSPESFAMHFMAPGDGAAPSAAPQVPKKAQRNTLPVLEDLTTYGTGKDRVIPGVGRERQKSLGQLAVEETRSKTDRVANADPGAAWVKNLNTFMAHSGAYRQIRDAQVAKLVEMGMSPEEIAKLTREQMQQLAPVSINDLSPEQILNALRVDDGGQEASIHGLSTRDSKLAKMLNLVDNGGVPTLDDYFKWWRYQFPTAQGGQIIRPGLAPSGEFMARATRGTMGLFDSNPQWVAQTTPMFDKAIREQAHTRPKEVGYRGNEESGAMTAMDFRNLLLDPYRGGVYLKQAEGNWPFPQYTDGLYMWKDETPHVLGESRPGPITSGLIDEQGAGIRPETPISTPEADAPQPVITPADDELGMYDPRKMNPSVLAALLA